MSSSLQQRTFIILLLLLVVVAAGISMHAYTLGGGRNAEGWLEGLGEGGGWDGGAHGEGGGGPGEGNRISLVVDPLQYGIVLLFMAVISGAVIFWYRYNSP